MKGKVKKTLWKLKEKTNELVYGFKDSSIWILVFYSVLFENETLGEFNIILQVQIILKRLSSYHKNN